MEVNKKLSDFSTEELLNELLKRDKNGSSEFHLINETVTSYTFKFYKFS